MHRAPKQSSDTCSFVRPRTLVLMELHLGVATRLLPLDMLTDHLRWDSGNQAPGRNILGDDRTSSNNRSIANRDALQNHCTGANPHMLPYGDAFRYLMTTIQEFVSIVIAYEHVACDGGTLAGGDALRAGDV